MKYNTKTIIRSMDISIFKEGAAFTKKQLEEVLKCGTQNKIDIRTAIKHLEVRGISFEKKKEGRESIYKVVSTHHKVDAYELLKKGGKNASDSVLSLMLDELEKLRLEHGDSFTVSKNFLMENMDDVFKELKLEMEKENASNRKAGRDTKTAKKNAKARLKDLENMKAYFEDAHQEVPQKVKDDIEKEKAEIKCIDYEDQYKNEGTGASRFKADLLSIIRDEAGKNKLRRLANEGIIVLPRSEKGKLEPKEEFVFYTENGNRAIDKSEEYDYIMSFAGEELRINEHNPNYRIGMGKIIEWINYAPRLKNKYKNYNARFRIDFNSNIDIKLEAEETMKEYKKNLHNKIIKKLEKKFTNELAEIESLKKDAFYSLSAAEKDEQEQIVYGQLLACYIDLVEKEYGVLDKAA